MIDKGREGKGEDTKVEWNGVRGEERNGVNGRKGKGRER